MLVLAEWVWMVQGRGVVETSETARRWSGYVCPDCRFVFRVPRDHDGRGLVCPGCLRLLAIPGAGDVVPPLRLGTRKAGGLSGAGGDEGVEPVVAVPDAGEVVDRRSVERVEPGGGMGISWLLIGGAVLFCSIVAVVVVVLRTGPRDEVLLAGGEVAVAPPVAAAGGQAAKGAERSDASILVEAESVVRDFLGARNVEDLLKVVRDPEVAAERMKREYPDGRVDPPGVAEFNPGKSLVREDGYFTVTVRTRDFELRRVHLVDSGGRLRVDWESWVGWCEVAWPEFIATQPEEARVARVVVKKVDYYNFGFTDESRWRSYRLESRDGGSVVYGYVERDSEVDRRIQLSPEQKQVQMVLRLRYPAGSTRGDQVLIDGVVADGWVEVQR